MGAKQYIESVHLSVEPHLYGDHTFGCMTILLGHANPSGALRLEFVITFDIQGAANREEHYRLLVTLSEESDVTTLDHILTTPRYAILETVEVTLGVGHFESRPVKWRETLWMEHIEVQLRAVQSKGIPR